MGSTEQSLGEEHLAGCLALSASAHWNQNEADWRLMLSAGRGWGIVLADGTLAASTVVLPYGGRFAWISMVLVLPDQRRKGYATRLLQRALRENASAGLVSILDATPAGRAVYLQEGFADRWGFRRFAISTHDARIENNSADVRALAQSDWPALLELDRRAFGASREPLLRNLAGRLPATALVAYRNGALTGFVLGRDGREACQIGPLVAADHDTARALFATTLARAPLPVYADIADHAPALQAWALAQGFAVQRPFTRMVHPATSGPAPGDAPLVFCPAGPELG